MQKQFRYIYNNEEVSREDFEKLAGDSFKWFDGDSIVSVPFSSFDSFFTGDFKSRRQINDHLDSVLNIYQNKVTDDIINKPKCSPQCFCDGSCKKPQEKKLGGYIKPNVYVSSTRHKAREEGNFHKEIVGDLEGINRPPSTDDKNLAKKDNYTIYVFTKDLLPKILEFEDLRAIKSILKRYSASSYRVYDKDKNLIEQDVLNKDDVITNSNRGEKETMEYLQGLKYNNLKPSLDIVINRQFPKTLQLIALATEYGHKKYIENDVNYLNYKSVKGGSQTYFDASARHSTDRNGLDESGLPHIIHAVWSSLAGLELWAEENNINIKEFTENYMKNLHNSK